MFLSTPRSTPTASLFPYTTLFRSIRITERTAERLDDTLIPVLHLEEHTQFEIDVFRPDAEKALLLFALRPVQVEDDLAEGIASLFEAEDRKSTRLNSSH